MGLRGKYWRNVFSRRYTFALLLLACVWTVVCVVQYKTVTGERNRATVIAMAAEQAALSQRIAFLVADLDPSDQGCVQLAACPDLLATAERMQANHRILTGETRVAGLGEHLRPLAEIYAAGATPFREEVETFLYAASSFARGSMEEMDADGAVLLERIENSGINTLMQTHALIVDVLEAEANRAIQAAAVVTGLSWVLSLIVLMVISRKVFLPMVRRLFAAFEEMEKAQRRALEAAKSAERANRVRGEFLKTASHELKTPLNAIMGLAEVIRHGDDKADQLLSEMSHASDHLLSMLNTMLDSHKIDEGKLQIAEGEVALADELISIASIAGDFTERKGLAFSTRFDVPSAIRVKTDQQRLRQVCLNLLDNAARFTDEGEVHFSASFTDQCGKQTLKITVDDTGVGIEEARLEEIFDRFSSVASVDEATSGGLGLGLAFTKTIVEMMGGSVELATQIGKGSCFIVHIPMETVYHGQAADPTLDHVQTKKVLIVDDNMPNRLVAEAMVQLLGGETILVEDGLQAVKRAESERFDLILMDISMPVMDGITATETIRNASGPNQYTPIVAVTAHVAQEDVPDLIERGFQAVMHKPMRKTLMESIFDEYTSERDARRAESAGVA